MHPMPVVSDNRGDIFDCIQKGDIEMCVQFVQSDRSILKQKGWGGFTPLHYAALHGTRSLVNFFLSNGADPNLTCDAGQTAFHFACRQGNIFIIHQMMQYGADLRLIDLQQKTSLHHAVTGGSIVAVHYLWETGMFRFSDTDMYHVTPLHLAASTGNTEVVRYLLRDQRCAVDAVDQQGATALHIAAERGGVEVCWTLMQRTGCRMLHQKNHSGLTPLDLSKQGKTFRHQQLTKLLNRYINEPLHHNPRESNVLYYWTLLFPTLTGAAILLIAAMLGGYGGLTCGLLFPWLARSIFTQYHRMTTYQRLPNPIYLGTLIAGLFHSLLCFYGKMFPPDYTKHCKLCEMCIKDYDHHCLFLNRCVGRGNHRLFLFFIFSMGIAHLLFVATATSYLYGKMPVGNRSFSLWLTLFGEEFWVVVMVVMNALTLLWEVWLLIEQFDAVATGTTTYFRQCESSARQRSLGQRWVIVLSYLLEGRRRVGRGQLRADKAAIDI
uniref:Palmitoyltransferase n=1 Tax=Gasterosteus aculeatus aculeatus TaxID=481459 RepID=A0AAQ4QZ55_GASAC